MTKKKSHSQILHSYTNLVARVKADEAFLTSFPDRPEPQHEPESIDDASLDDLNHLRDLIHLRDQLTMLKHRLPVTNSLVFTAPSNDILGTPYKQTDYNTIKELNTGSFSLSLKASVNQGLLKYELKVFDILQDLKGLNRVSETPLCHRRFHDNLLVQTILILGDVDLLKEAEWNRQRSRSSRSQEQHVLRNEHNADLHAYLKDPTNLVAHTCHILVLMMHLSFGLARRATRVLVQGLCSILLLGNAASPALAMDLTTIL